MLPVESYYFQCIKRNYLLITCFTNNFYPYLPRSTRNFLILSIQSNVALVNSSHESRSSQVQFFSLLFFLLFGLLVLIAVWKWCTRGARPAGWTYYVLSAVCESNFPRWFASAFQRSKHYSAFINFPHRFWFRQELPFNETPSKLTRNIKKISISWHSSVVL